MPACTCCREEQISGTSVESYLTVGQLPLRRSMTSTEEVQEAGKRWQQHFTAEHSEAAAYLARLAEPLVPVTLIPCSASSHAAKPTPPQHASPTDPFSLAASESDAAAASGLPQSPRLAAEHARRQLGRHVALR